MVVHTAYPYRMISTHVHHWTTCTNLATSAIAVLTGSGLFVGVHFRAAICISHHFVLQHDIVHVACFSICMYSETNTALAVNKNISVYKPCKRRGGCGFVFLHSSLLVVEWRLICECCFCFYHECFGIKKSSDHEQSVANFDSEMHNENATFYYCKLLSVASIKRLPHQYKLFRVLWILC